MPPSIHITGASGSGTSTLGRALAARLEAVHLDTDDFYWASVEPKFSVKRPRDERIALIEAAIAEAGPRGFVLAGSISEWGNPLVPHFSLVVFLTAPTAVRLDRLRRREAAMFGTAAIAPGGARHAEFEAFIAWAGGYDSGTDGGRNRPRHEAWLAGLPCPLLRLDGTAPVEELVAAACTTLGASV